MPLHPPRHRRLETLLSLRPPRRQKPSSAGGLGPRSGPHRLTLLLGTALLLLAGAALFATAIPDPPYSTDSWTYWDLARSLSRRPYQIPVLRDYQSTQPWSIAFPPLWPAVNALAAALLGTGPITLLLVNVAVFAAFAAAAAAAASALFASPIPGLLAALLMLTDASWRDELLAGRPIPFQLTLLCALAATLAADLRPAARNALAGLLCGLMLATKFDVAPLVAIVFLYLLTQPGRRTLPLFLLLAALPPLPWAWFSWTHFGQLYASDGGPIAASTDPAAFTTDFRLSWHPTLRDDPAAWLHKLVPHARALSWSLQRSWSAAQLAAAVFGLTAAAFQVRRPNRAAVVLLVALLGLLASLSSYVATGFVDARYFAPLRFLVGLAACGAVWLALGRWRPQAAALAALAVFAAATAPLAGRPWSWRPSPSFADPPGDAARAACLDTRLTGRLLFLDDDLDAARFGALTGRPTGMLPANFDRLSPAALATFIDRFGFGAVAWRSPLGLARAQRLGPVVPLPPCSGLATLAPPG